MKLNSHRDALFDCNTSTNCYCCWSNLILEKILSWPRWIVTNSKQQTSWIKTRRTVIHYFISNSTSFQTNELVFIVLLFFSLFLYFSLSLHSNLLGRLLSFNSVFYLVPGGIYIHSYIKCSQIYTVYMNFVVNIHTFYFLEKCMSPNNKINLNR